jgi:hypothetical protein
MRLHEEWLWMHPGDSREGRKPLSVAFAEYAAAMAAMDALATVHSAHPGMRWRRASVRDRA